MRAKLVFGIALLLVTGFATAQTTDINPEPGIITADSPLYPVDKAFDGVTKSDGEVAFERASEYSVAQERNQTRARERAMRSLNNSIADVASSNKTKGLEKAEAVLQQVRERTPDQANQGLDKAISNIGKARNGNLKPSDVGRPGNMTGMGGQPDDAGSQRP